MGDQVSRTHDHPHVLPCSCMTDSAAFDVTWSIQLERAKLVTDVKNTVT